MFAMEADYPMYRLEERWQKEAIVEHKDFASSFAIIVVLCGIVFSIFTAPLYVGIVSPSTEVAWRLMFLIWGATVLTAVVLIVFVPKLTPVKTMTSNKFDWWAHYGTGDNVVDFIVNQIVDRDFKTITTKEDAVLVSLFKGSAEAIALNAFTTDAKKNLAVKLVATANSRVATLPVVAGR